MVIKFAKGKIYWRWWVDGDPTEWQRYPGPIDFPTHDQTIQWLTNKLKEQHHEGNDEERNNAKSEVGN